MFDEVCFGYEDINQEILINHNISLDFELSNRYNPAFNGSIYIYKTYNEFSNFNSIFDAIPYIPGLK